MFDIAKNVQRVVYKQEPSPFRKELNETMLNMKVGDSFVIPHAKNIHYYREASKYPKGTFSSNKCSKTEIRIFKLLNIVNKK